WKSYTMIKIKTAGSNATHQVAYMFGADKDFMKTFGVTLLEGRNFNTPADSSGIIINETAAKMLGVTSASGQVVDIPAFSRGGESSPFNVMNTPFTPRVIGIVKDFHFQS